MNDLSPSDRALVERYRAGVDAVLAVTDQVGESEWDRHEGDDPWTARMVVHHLADSETRSYVRLRQLLVEPEPAQIQGYDEALWASSDVLGYEVRPVGPSLDVFRAVRVSSGALLSELHASDLDRRGTHSESGAYTLRDWLSIYADHAEDHAAQIARAAGVSGAKEDR